MDIVCGFRNKQDIAKSVTERARQIEARAFSPRPWNRFEPENTDWWIVPSTDWPAYRHGKGMFRSTQNFPEQVLCCLNVEKGFDRVVGEAFPKVISAGQVIDAGWLWSAFLAGLTDGSIAQAAQSVEEETGGDVILEISAWYPRDHEGFEPYSLSLDETLSETECRSPEDAGLIWYGVAGDELHNLGHRCLGDITKPLANCHRLDGLAKALQADPKLSWAWLDVYLGVLVTLLPEGDQPGDHWEADRVWDQLFRPWLRWIA